MALPLLLILCLVLEAQSNEEEKLLNVLFNNYDARIRPARFYGDVIDVTLKLTLTNLISLKEKEETLTTNVWIEIQWTDYRLSWNSSDYAGIELVRIPSRMVWLPEIVLENNIDGGFEIAYYANVLVSNDGSIYWLPPAIYRSACAIAVTYFPFDWQNCSLVFRSQAYNAHEINLELSTEEGTLIEWIHIDPEDFTAGCQKCTLSISVLLAQTIFLFLIAQKIPETSLNVPLIGKYLIFVMVVCTLIVTNCVIVLNVSLRTPNTHSMSEKIKQVRAFATVFLTEYEWEFSHILLSECSDIDIGTTVDLYRNLAHFAPDIKTCVDACNFIAKSTKEQNDFESENENWILIGKVIDKACFWIALLLFTIGTVTIFLTGHFNQAPEFPFPGDPRKYTPD
ncbi:hypothetical protein chiPu_0017837 [Chiloscyllium punctatum]|uniref:Neurotransmitter-gated ion-channel ligand-binding domain-containing protein n=1 Tax=Chiloscyllium punctatum TaxID=137246 RepID=A0A401RJ70_CHIPU|nr:hypothetical protein [Chiloscyllium punctatum]